MLCFIQHARFDGISFRLCFSEFRAGECRKFFVLAVDEGGTRYPFNMEGNNNTWRIVNAPKVADPLLKNEERLSEIIREHVLDSLLG